MRHNRFEIYVTAFVLFSIIAQSAARANDAPIVRSTVRAIGSVPPDDSLFFPCTRALTPLRRSRGHRLAGMGDLWRWLLIAQRSRRSFLCIQQRSDRRHRIESVAQSSLTGHQPKQLTP